MASSVNKVILLGNLGKDPEIRRLENGTPVATFSLATSESITDKLTGQKREITDWHNVVLWRGLAEIAERFLRKGHKVYVEGKLRTRSWNDKEGNPRYVTEILAEDITLLTPRTDTPTPPLNTSTSEHPYPIEPDKPLTDMNLDTNLDDDFGF